MTTSVIPRIHSNGEVSEDIILRQVRSSRVKGDNRRLSTERVVA